MEIKWKKTATEQFEAHLGETRIGSILFSRDARQWYGFAMEGDMTIAPKRTGRSISAVRAEVDQDILRNYG